MSKYLKSYFHQVKKDGVFITTEEQEKTIVNDEHLKNATCLETRRYFQRVFDSKQVLRKYKNKIVLYSYAPNSTEERTVLIFEKLEDSNDD